MRKTSSTNYAPYEKQLERRNIASEKSSRFGLNTLKKVERGYANQEKMGLGVLFVEKNKKHNDGLTAIDVWKLIIQ